MPNKTPKQLAREARAAHKENVRTERHERKFVCDESAQNRSWREFFFRNPLVLNKEYNKRWNQSLPQYIWNYFHNKSFLKSITWMGIPVRKSIFDLWVYQEILFENKPDLIIEIGSLYGGSTLYLAQLLEMIGNGNVISIDLNHENFQAQHHRIETIEGDCSEESVIKQIKSKIQNKTVMVVHDGDHSEESVIRDLSLYAPFVTKGQYLIVEDGIYDLFNPKKVSIKPNQRGPLKAIRKFIAGHSNEFIVDKEREKFNLTTNPWGYLRKVK